MHQILKHYAAVITIAALGFSVIANAATPAENLNLTITRTAASGLQSSGTLVKNVFRQDSVQVPYTVKEPYTETEIYYEQVPYKETETYYEQVPYQETESYYETVPYTEQEAYTDYENYTDYEYRCEERSRNERVCHDVESCHIVPGAGSDGGPRRECTKQPVCENVTKRYQECGNVAVRKTRPVTKYRTVTKYREERRSRTVTKYRDERRTRTVTKYRQEKRTRTVTKHRNKEVCCKTEIRNVFDHQFKMPVEVNFPAETALVGNEQESFNLAFTGTEAAPAVSLTPKSAIFGYVMDHQEFRGGAMVVHLKRVALYNQDQLGATSIKNLGLRLTSNGAEIRFNDQGLRPRVNSAYSYQIHEVGTQDILAQGSVAAGNAQAVIPVQVALVENKTYQVDVRVVRQGLPLAANIDVVVSATQKLSSLKDTSVYTNKAMLNTFEIRGEKEQARLFFRDQAPSDEGVSTTYRIDILVGDKTVSSKNIAREHMIVSTKDFYRMMLGADLAVPAQVLKTSVRAGKVVVARVIVTRQHIGLNGGTPVSFTVSHTAEIRAE